MVFDGIYRTNAWHGTESRSGPGSGDAPTLHVKAELVALVEDLGVRSVLDAACGDGYWMPDLPNYVGVDVSRTAIERARVNHPERMYLVRDVARGRLPTCDLVIVRDALQHLSLRDGMALLARVSASGAVWLLASTFVGGENVDIETGHAYAPDLEVEPFSLGQPDRLIFDGYGYFDADAIRDPRKHLGLWSLR